MDTTSVTDSDTGTVVVDLEFDPDAHEIVEVPDSSDDESGYESSGDESVHDEETGFLCPTCSRRTNEEHKIAQCTDGHGVCNSCFRRYLSLKRLRVGDCKCCLYVWCNKKYVS